MLWYPLVGVCLVVLLYLARIADLRNSKWPDVVRDRQVTPRRIFITRFLNLCLQVTVFLWTGKAEENGQSSDRDSKVLLDQTVGCSRGRPREVVAIDWVLRRSTLGVGSMYSQAAINHIPSWWVVLMWSGGLKIETWEAWAGFNMSHWSIAVHIDSVPWERISAQPAFHFVASEEGEEIKCHKHFRIHYENYFSSCNFF